jgi:hypothetical protein
LALSKHFAFIGSFWRALPVIATINATALYPLPTSRQDQGGAISLDAYMRLPPDQYDELDPGMIQALGGSQFLLKVPRLAVSTDWAAAGWHCMRISTLGHDMVVLQEDVLFC